MIAPLTFVVDLDSLTGNVATFRHLPPNDGASKLELRLDRPEWENLGRPSRLWIPMYDQEVTL